VGIKGGFFFSGLIADRAPSSQGSIKERRCRRNRRRAVSRRQLSEGKRREDSSSKFEVMGIT
jgi:hypothetical protein